jgi:hypothetical protein
VCRIEIQHTGDAEEPIVWRLQVQDRNMLWMTLEVETMTEEQFYTQISLFGVFSDAVDVMMIDLKRRARDKGYIL